MLIVRKPKKKKDEIEIVKVDGRIEDGVEIKNNQKIFANYKKVGDNYVLDIEGVDSHPKVKNLYKTMKDERDAHKALDKELKKLKNSLDGIDVSSLKDVDLKNYKDNMEKLSDLQKEKDKLEIKQLEDRKDWDKLQIKLAEKYENDLKLTNDSFKSQLEDITTANETKINEFSAKTGKLEKALKSAIIDKELIVEISKAGGNGGRDCSKGERKANAGVD